ncbi:MarR family winged helix-turn-helix transcriptional regulator [Subtercola sp. YIM 133946]|uniref:MarR family winged helix-turn-helix transcriptional regulator n=1 Tax=Subtercola sp. YIM 133946 TaxID=3118909 RepID=UPI002F93371A
MKHPNPARSRTFVLMRQIVQIQGRAGEQWIRERDISLEQGFILGYLLEHPGAIQRDVAAATRRGEANASSMLQKLEKRGLVERRIEPGDDRSKRVFATPEGAALIQGLDSAMAGVDDSLLAPLNETERSTLQTLLERIAQHAE